MIMNSLSRQPLSEMIHDSHDLQSWIYDHAPSKEEAEQNYNLFIRKTNINGSAKFTGQIKRIIAAISKLALGHYLLKKIRENCDDIRIEETEKKNYCNAGPDRPILLNFKYKLYELSENPEGEKYFRPFTKKLQTIHQLLHFYHYAYNKEEYQILRTLEATIPKKGGFEEELTITGNLNVKKSKHHHQELCCENSIRVELGIPCRVTYQGLVLDSPIELKEIIRWKAIGNLRDWLERNNLEKEDNSLEYLSTRMNTKNVSSPEWLTMVELLHRGGAQFCIDFVKRIVKLDHQDIIQYILDNKVCSKKNILDFALLTGNFKLVNELLEQNIQPNMDILKKRIEYIVEKDLVDTLQLLVTKKIYNQQELATLGLQLNNMRLATSLFVQGVKTPSKFAEKRTEILLTASKKSSTGRLKPNPQYPKIPSFNPGHERENL